MESSKTSPACGGGGPRSGGGGGAAPIRVRREAVNRARRLRKDMSLPEVMLWKTLRGREEGKPVFRRQHPLGPYVLDFFCASARLCIEIDGGAHGFGDRPAADARRDAYLRSLGIDVVRYAAAEEIGDAYGVATGLIQLARDRVAPTPTKRSPPPRNG
jgi:very-short-patch-repair endonuclease